MADTRRQLLLDLLPPVALRAAKALRDVVRPAGFEFVGHEWPSVEPETAGWEAQGVTAARERQWTTLKASLAGVDAFGVGPDALESPFHLDTGQQAIHLAFAYALARAATGHAKAAGSRLRVLDWGGEIGSYHEIAKALLPGLSFDWHCAELPAMAELGRRLNPEVTFHDDAGWVGSAFDFVFSSSSLQYLPDWRGTVQDLVSCARGPIFVTRLPFVHRTAGFVALQRVPEYGTAYHGWVFNRDEFTAVFEAAGARLDRAFVNHVGPRMKGAPEQNVYMGFLFRRT